MTATEPLLLGFDIGGTKTAVCVGTPQGTVLRREQFATGSHDATMRQALDAARDLVDHTDGSAERIMAAGISCGGPIDAERGVILSPPNLPGWDAVPVVQQVRENTGLPTRLENDANAGALAEWRFGAGRDCRNLVFLTAGTGMGAGLVLDGRLYRGGQGLAGEVGHIRLADDGPTGYGKAGSFEGFCSGGGIARLGRSMLAEPHAPSALDRIDPDSLTTRDIAQAAAQGDPLARRIVQTSGRMLGKGLAILIDCLNPELIVIGSLALRLGRLWLDPAMAVVEAEALTPARRACRIVPAELGDAVGDMASLAVALTALEA